ncbi:MAG: SMI1/KNR4 family protein [Defluviitaleaceae bacterium]|nr:SMI1/KNR4 family protein [Defluviitaleaceae bacterium]
MTSIIETLKNFSDLLSLSAVQESEITNAETKLSLKFAPEYREYISEFGAVAGNGHELTGILKSERLNVINATMKEWGLNPLAPRNLYVVENPAIDGIIIWQNADGEIFQSSPNSAPRVIASSLANYLTS